MHLLNIFYNLVEIKITSKPTSYLLFRQCLSAFHPFCWKKISSLHGSERKQPADGSVQVLPCLGRQPIGKNCAWWTAGKRRVTGSWSIKHEVSSEKYGEVSGVHGSKISWIHAFHSYVCTCTGSLYRWTVNRCCGTSIMLQSVTTLLTKTYFWEAFGMVWYYDIVSLFFSFYFVGCFSDQPISAKVVNLSIGPTSKTYTIEDYNYI